MNDQTLPKTETEVELVSLTERIEAWAHYLCVNKAVVKRFEDTESFTGKIKGLPSVAVIQSAEGLVMEQLFIKLVEHGKRLVSQGQPLPLQERPVIEIDPAVKACVRLSTLRKLILQRSGEWGVTRKNLPPHILSEVLSDFDLLINRVASQLKSAYIS
jgi:hypothetical protein